VSSRTRELQARDQRALWHPFTQMSDWLDGHPVVIERGEGNHLVDTEGNRYLDGVSSLWVNLHGHDHPVLRARIREQLDKIAHSTLLGLAGVPSIELAAKLIEVAPPGLTRVFFSDNGSTAVEVALKIAFQYWQQKSAETRVRTRFVALRDAYHGDTLGAVAVGGIERFHEAFRPLVFDVLRAQNAYCYRCPYGLAEATCGIHCLESLEAILERHGHEVAGVVVEPLLQAAAGMLRLPDGWLRRVRELCDHHGTLLIADEVATGFGRTGKMFACQHENVSPDLLAVAKGMTAGFLPLGATLASEEIFDAFLAPVHASRQFFHGHSFTGTRSPARRRSRTSRSSRRSPCSSAWPSARRSSGAGSRTCASTARSATSGAAGSWRAWSWCATARPARRTTRATGSATRCAWRSAGAG
jgi:adenosylmethionine-8-amino-7-oxononanoate aminotransferase